MADTQQTYKIEITVECDPEKDGHPRDWLDKALKKGSFKRKTLTIYGTDITPLDKEDPANKWIKDFK